jgi:hypothetical protein
LFERFDFRRDRMIRSFSKEQDANLPNRYRRTQSDRAQKVGLNPLLDFVAKGVEFSHVCIVAREEYLQTQAPLVKRFMTAYVEGIRFFKTRKEEAVRKMMVLSRLNDREIAEKAFDVYRRSLPDDGRPTMKGLESVLADFAREEPKTKGLRGIKGTGYFSTDSSAGTVLSKPCGRASSVKTSRTQRRLGTERIG